MAGLAVSRVVQVVSKDGGTRRQRRRALLENGGVPPQSPVGLALEQVAVRAARAVLAAAEVASVQQEILPRSFSVATTTVDPITCGWA
jgi:hypothetical protein